MLARDPFRRARWAHDRGPLLSVPDELCCDVDGFSLHAKILVEAHERERLEHSQKPSTSAASGTTPTRLDTPLGNAPAHHRRLPHTPLHAPDSASKPPPRPTAATPC